MATSHGRPAGSTQPPGVPAHYDYPRVPVTRLLDDAAQDFPESTALDVGGHRLAYRQVLDQADRLATVLSELGVAPGDQVGTLLATPPQLLLTAFATWRLGAVAVLLDPTSDREALAEALTRERCRVLVVDDVVYPALAALKGDVPAVRHVLGTGVEDYLPFPRNVWHPVAGRRDGSFARAPRAEGVTRFKEAIRRTAPGVGQAPVARDATAAVIGGVRVGHHHIVAAAFQLRLWVPDVQAGRERLLVGAAPWGPLGLSALLGLGVLAAATVTVPVGTAANLPRAAGSAASWVTDRAAGSARFRRRRGGRHGPSLLVIDAASDALIDQTGRAWPSLRVVLTDTAVDPDRAERLHEATGARLRGGLAGPAGLVAANPVYGRAELGSAGLPLPDTCLAALDAAGGVLPTGSPGRLAATGEALPGTGWWPLGPRGWIDADGYVELSRDDDASADHREHDGGDAGSAAG